MKLTIAAAILCLAAFSAKADDKCDALKPTNAQDVDESFKGKMEGEIKGVLSHLAGGAADISGEYRKLVTDKLKDYPASDKLYVWERILYLACVSPDMKIDLNTLLQLYMRPPDVLGNNPTPEPTIGWLQPANEPTPPNGCLRHPPHSFDPKDSVLMVLGDNGFFRSKDAPANFRNRNVIQMGGCQLLSLETGPNGARINALIYDLSGELLGKIEANKFVVPYNSNLIIEKSGDLSTLVVHDTADNELLYVRYMNRLAFRIRGTFTCPTSRTRTLIINDSEMVDFPFSDSCIGNSGAGDVSLP